MLDLRNLAWQFGNFIRQSVHVMHVATRPKQKEFERIVMITGAAAILIGLAGVLLTFLISFIMRV